jgi:very-short-patch-repair endonuclease
MLKKDKLIQEKYNGIHPICKCGCEENTTYDPGRKDFPEYKRGHQTRVIKNYFGDPKNPKRVEKIISTRKQKFDSGEYDHIKKQVSKPRSEEIKNKISKSGKGVSRSKKEGFGVGRKQSEETKQKMSNSAIQRIIKTGKVKRSKLEIQFELFFKLLNINFKESYYINTKENHFIYDFYLPKYKCLVEIDGDFWHCNPNTKHALPECKTQEINIINDQLKNQWAQDNGYKLLRFWENDINSNPQQIIEILKKELLENCK